MSESELIIMDFFLSTLNFFWQIWDKHLNLFELHMQQSIVIIIWMEFQSIGKFDFAKCRNIAIIKNCQWHF